MSPVLHLYDTRRRSVRPFEPREPGRAGIYTCGPTVYGPQHLGNMRSQLVPDLLRRVLIASGLDVTYVTNITDVGHLVSDADEGEDKVEAAAAREGTSVGEITGRWTEQWAVDRRRLGCLEPDIIPRASEHLADQIAMVQTLEARGFTYVIEDGVYFDVAAFPRYAEFAGLALDDLVATGRVEHLADKRHPADFALWKCSPGQKVSPVENSPVENSPVENSPVETRRLQEWESPWGIGFPGWHIECSAMATRYLGETFDLHTGGVDHVRVHHSNEIAQSECALDVHPWVSFWVHSEFLDLAGEKISKSKGHALVVDTLVERGIDPLAFRYFSFQAHYRQQQTFSFAAVAAAGTALRRLVHHAVVAREAVSDEVALVTGGRAGELHSAFWAALTDDLNSSRALAIATTTAKEPELSAADRWGLLADFDRALGFGLATAVDPAAVGDVTEDPAVLARLAERQAAKAARDFAAADAIRDELAAAGIEIIDTPDGPRARLSER